MSRNSYIKFRRGAQATLSGTLGLGEPGFTTDTKRLYVGDGLGNALIGPGPSSFLELDDTPSAYTNGRYVVTTASGLTFESNYLENLIYVHSAYTGEYSDGSFDHPFTNIADAITFTFQHYGPNDNVGVHMLPGEYSLSYQASVTHPAVKSIIGTSAESVIMKPADNLVGMPFAVVTQPLKIANITIDATDNPAFLTTSGSIGALVNTNGSPDEVEFVNCTAKGFNTSFSCISGSNLWFESVNIYRTCVGVDTDSGSLVAADLLYIDGAKDKHIWARGGSEVYIGESELSSAYEEDMIASGTGIYIEGTGTHVEIFAGTKIWSCDKNIFIKDNSELKVDNCVLEDTNSTPGIIQGTGSSITILNSRAPLGSDDLSIASPEFCYINSFDSSGNSTTIGRGAISDQTLFTIETGQSSRPYLFFDSNHEGGRHAVAFVEPNAGQAAEFYSSSVNGISSLGSHIEGNDAFAYEAEIQVISDQNADWSGWIITKGTTDQPKLYIKSTSSLHPEVIPLNLYFDGAVTLASGVKVNRILDEDDFASNDPKALITQQSAKTFITNYGYSSTALDSGQLDTRYYTQSQINTISGALDARALDIDGDKKLIADWDAGDYAITASGFVVGNARVDYANYSNVTGLLTGGALSINTTDNTLVDIEAGTSLYVNMDDRDNPIVEVLSWPAQSYYPAISGSITKWIGVQRTAPGVGSIVGNHKFSQSDKRYITVLGRCWNFAAENTIEDIGNYKSGAFNVISTVEDLAYTLGTINISGNKFFPTASGSLKLSRSSGEAFRYGANYSSDPISPNIYLSPTTSGISDYSYQIQNSVALSTSLTDIDPNYYDLHGEKIAVPSGTWSVQRVYYYPVSNVVLVTYGQYLYDTVDDAMMYMASEDLVLNTATMEGSVLRAFLILKSGCTDLTDTTQAKVVEAAALGSSGGGSSGGGAGVTDISQLTGLLGDNFPQYLRTDGTRDVTGPMKYSYDVTFNNDYDLVDKKYVDTLANAFSMSHHDLTNLTTYDDHPQYLNQTRGDSRYYTQDQINTLSGSLMNFITANTSLATVQVARTTTYYISNTWVDIDFDTTVYENNSSTISHDTTNTSRININETGTFLITYGVTVGATYTTTSTYGRLTLNGITDIPASDAYVRTYQGEIHELSGIVTLNINAGDYVTLQLYRSAEGAVNAEAVSLNVIKLDGIKGDKGDQGIQGIPGTDGTDGLVTISGSAFFDAYDGAGDLQLTGSWQDVHFGQTRKNTGSWILTSETELTIPSTNTYIYTARVTTTDTSGSSRSDSVMRVVKDTGSGYTEVPGSIAYMYNRESGAGTNTGNVTILDDFSAGDKIKVQVMQTSGNDTLYTLANGSSITIHIPGGMPGKDGVNGSDGLPGTGSTINAQDEGTNVPNNPHSTFNFTGAGVTATDAGDGIVDINIPGGSGGITIEDEGAALVGSPHTTINFVGANVSAYDMGAGVAEVYVEPPTFGTWYAWDGDESTTSTNSTYPINKATLNVTGIPAGYYRFSWYYEHRRNTASNDFCAQAQIDNTNTVMEVNEEPKDINSWYSKAGYVIVELTTGNHTFTLDYWGEYSSNTSYVRRARLELWRVS